LNSVTVELPHVCDCFRNRQWICSLNATSV